MTMQKTPVLPHRLAYELDWPVVRPAELSELALPDDGLPKRTAQNDENED